MAADASAVPVAGPHGNAVPAEHGAGTVARAAGLQPPGFVDLLQQEVLVSNQALAASNLTLADRT